MNCSACGQQNRPEAKFCSGCGGRLERRCPTCRQVVPEHAKFCDQCGANLVGNNVHAASPAAPSAGSSAAYLESPEKVTRNQTEAKLVSPSEAERRHLTIMFCDLVDSTGLSERLDPEDMRNVLAEYQTRCRDVIDRLGGHIARYVGDGLLVYFGYPVAYEDAAIRAVHAGLDIVDNIRALDESITQRNIHLAVRIGINSGNVVVGDIGSGEAREQMAVVGAVPNVAARLQSTAAPGGVVIGGATQRLVRDVFDVEELGEQHLKGVSEPVSAYGVIGPAAIADRIQAIESRGFTRLVGREAEIGLLSERWQQIRSGAGQVVLLTGEAGIGKSRVIKRFSDSLAGEQNQHFYYCSAHHQSSAFYPIIVGIEQELGFELHDDNDAKLAKIESHLRAKDSSLETHVPIYAFLLGVSAKQKYPMLEMNPQQLKHYVLGMLVERFRAASRASPLLIVIEDLHWIDPSTLELLEILFQESNDFACLLVLTCRPEFELPWRHKMNFTMLALNRLNRVESIAIVDVISGGKPLPKQVLGEIIAKTDGVPLFLEELTKMVLESHLLTETQDAYELSGPLPPLAIPVSLQDSLMARLDKLAPTKEVAQVAAILGRRFNHSLLASATGLNEKELGQAITQLLDAELIVKRGIAPDIVYEFKHALVQDAAYQTLLKSTRQHYHLRVAQILESQFSDLIENNPELLARHYGEAQLAEEAITHWLRAGQKAVSRSANLEAISHFEKGLECIGLMPEGQERSKKEIELQIALAVPLTSVKGYASPEVHKTYTRARELCLEVGDTTHFFPAIYGMWRFYLLRAEYAIAQDLSVQLISIAESTSESVFKTAAPRAAGGTYFYRGKLAEARRSLDQVIESHPTDEDRSRALLFDVVDALVASYSYNAWSLWLLGYPDQARKNSELAIKTANSLNHQFSIALANSFASWTFEFCGDMQRTADISSAALDLSRQYGFQFWVGWAKMLLTHAQRGRGSDNYVPMEQSLQEWRETGSELGQTYFLTLLADAGASAGHYEQAFALLDQAEKFASQTQEAFWLPEVLRKRGELLLASGRCDLAAAEAAFEAARSEAKKQSSKSLELRALMSLLRYLRARQNTASAMAAEKALQEVYGFFTEGFDTADLIAARSLLDDTSVQA